MSEQSCRCTKHIPLVDEEVRDWHWKDGRITGVGRTYFDNLRTTLTDEDRADPHEFGVDLDDEGCARLRPVTVVDQLDRMIADWLVGEVE